MSQIAFQLTSAFIYIPGHPAMKFPSPFAFGRKQVIVYYKPRLWPTPCIIGAIFFFGSWLRRYTEYLAQLFTHNHSVCHPCAFYTLRVMYVESVSGMIGTFKWYIFKFVLEILLSLSRLLEQANNLRSYNAYSHVTTSHWTKFKHHNIQVNWAE